MNLAQSRKPRARSVVILGCFIFFSRWLQAPLYVGLIVAQGAYVYLFLKELWHLVERVSVIDETDIRLTVLGLIDVVMIANLLIMVIVGGYQTFVSRLNLEEQPDQPKWMSYVNGDVLKVKLATALIGISSVNLLKTFIEASAKPISGHAVMWQLLLHLTFVFSALLLAITNRISNQTATAAAAYPSQNHRMSTNGDVMPASSNRR